MNGPDSSADRNTDTNTKAFPEHLRKWNWGAFVLNWVWGLANGVYSGMLMFVPGVNLIVPFVLGVKGNQWAWEKGDWKDEEEFLHTQKIWSRVGIGVMITIPTFFILVFGLLFFVISSSNAYQHSLASVQNNKAAQLALGAPIEFDDWFIMGSINSVNNYSEADIYYNVSGSKASGTVYFSGHALDDNWTTEYFQLVVAPGGPEIDLGKLRL